MKKHEINNLMEAYASVYEGYGKEKNEKGEKEEKECVDKEDKGKHNCAKKVCHEQFGEGTCIFGEHAAPDENGVVNFYDVLFEHGVEKDVPLSEMEVLVLVEHPSEGHRYEGEQLDEGDLGARAREAVNYQRGGYHGDADYFKKHQDAIDQRLLQMRPYGAKGFPSAKKETKKTTQVAHYQPEGELVDEGVGEKAAELLDKGTKKIQGGLEKMGVPINRTKRQMGTSPRGADHMRKAGVGPSEKPTGLNNSADLFDIVKGYLVSEGATEEEVYDMMAYLTAEQIEAIVEQGGAHYGLVGVPKKAIDAIPGVRALRTAASNTLHRLDYQHNAKPITVGDKVVPYTMINPGASRVTRGKKEAGRVTDLESGKSKNRTQIDKEL